MARLRWAACFAALLLAATTRTALAQLSAGARSREAMMGRSGSSGSGSGGSSTLGSFSSSSSSSSSSGGGGSNSFGTLGGATLGGSATLGGVAAGTSSGVLLGGLGDGNNNGGNNIGTSNGGGNGNNNILGGNGNSNGNSNLGSANGRLEASRLLTMLLSATEVQSLAHLCQPRPHVIQLGELSGISERSANEFLYVLRMVENMLQATGMATATDLWADRQAVDRCCPVEAAMGEDAAAATSAAESSPVISINECPARRPECCVMLLLLAPSGAVACKELPSYFFLLLYLC